MKTLLAKQYSRLVTISAIPLAMVIIAFGAYQFLDQREEEFYALRQAMIGQTIALNSIVKAARDHVRAMQHWSQDYLEFRRNGLPSPLQSLLSRHPDQNQAAAGTGYFLEVVPPLQNKVGHFFADKEMFERRPTDESEIDLALELFTLMELAHLSTPYFQRSYYLSARRDLMTVFPWVDSFEQVAQIGNASHIAHHWRGMFAYDVFKNGTPERNPGRKPYWSAPYLDADGRVLMVSHAVPVYRGDDFTGVVATDIRLDFLIGFLRSFSYPVGKLWIVSNDQHQILADSDGLAARGIEVLRFADTLPEPLRQADMKQLLSASSQFREIEGFHVLAIPMRTVPWTVLYAASARDIDFLLLPRLAPYGIILAVLILTWFLTQLAVRRWFITPATSLVDYIGAEAQTQEQPIPKVPDMWQPWLEIISQTFQANRSYIHQLQDSEALKAAVIDSALDAIVTANEAGEIVEFNPSAERIFERRRDAVIGLPVSEVIVPPRLRQRHQQGMRRYLETGETHILGRRTQFEAMRADGSIIPVEMAINEVRQANRSRHRLFTAYLRDITERERMERALRESEQRFRSIAEAHPIPVWISEIERGRLIYVSPGMAELYGAPAAEIITKMPREFFVDQADRKQIRNKLLSDGGVDSYEFEMKKADGSTLPVAVTARRIDYMGVDAVVGGVVDLTERKRAEQEIARQREALYQSEKMSALGSLLAGVAHELNNPLSVVVGRSIMLEQAARDPEAAERAKKIRLAAERCARIVKTFLAIARQQPPKRRSIQLNAVIESAIELVSYGLQTADIDLTLELAPDLPELAVDVDQLTQVFTNLLVNAQQAMLEAPAPRQLYIATRLEPAVEAVEIEFTDNGPGVPDHIRPRIFEPFYTSKPFGFGTGIGLSLSHGIVEAHGGTITVETPSRGGARFIIKLPIVGTDKRPAREALAGMDRAQPSAVLIVDDEPEIADMLGEILRREGHRIDIAASGQAALNRLADCDYDIILSDLRMPDLDGPGLYRKLQASRPYLLDRIIFITGDTLGVGASDFLAETGRPLIEKPFVPKEVIQVVQGLLAVAAGDRSIDA